MKNIYYFTADWCQPCKKTRPMVEEMNREDKNIHFQIIDIDDNKELVQKFNIQAVPTFILFEEGIEKGRVVGAQTREQLQKFSQN